MKGSSTGIVDSEKQGVSCLTLSQTPHGDPLIPRTTASMGSVYIALQFADALDVKKPQLIGILHPTTDV